MQHTNRANSEQHMQVANNMTTKEERRAKVKGEEKREVTTTTAKAEREGEMNRTMIGIQPHG